jgi:hypothetical protein
MCKGPWSVKRFHLASYQGVIKARRNAIKKARAMDEWTMFDQSEKALKRIVKPFERLRAIELNRRRRD